MRVQLNGRSTRHSLVFLFFFCVLLCAGCGRDGGRPGQQETPIAKQNGSPAREPVRLKPLQEKPSIDRRSSKASSSGEARPGRTEPIISISGKVTLPQGEGAGSAKVELVRYNHGNWGERFTCIAETTASEEGSFRVVGPAAVSGYYLRATHPEAAVALVAVQEPGQWASAFAAGSRHRRIQRDIALVAGSSLAGRVVTEADDMPVSGALVAAALHGGSGSSLHHVAFTTTTADGSFVLRNLAQGLSTVSARAPGFQDFETSTGVPGGAITVRMKTGGATLAGVVTEHSTGAVVEGASVTVYLNDSATNILEKPQTITNRSGAFRLTNLAPGAYTVDARSPTLRKLPARKNESEWIGLRDGQTSEGYSIKLYGGHTIHGRITEKNSTAPIEGAKVDTASFGSPDSTTTVSAADGTYRLDYVFPLHSYVPVTATKPGMLMDAGSEGTEAGVFLKASPLEIEKDIEMVRAVSISGTVKLPNGSPAVGGVVMSRKAGGQRSDPVPVDGSGNYTIDVLPETDYVMSASARGYADTFSAKVNSGETGRQDVDIVLQEGGTITGVVREATGHALPDTDIRYEATGKVDQVDFGGETLLAKSGADGIFEINNVPARVIKLNPEKAGFISSGAVIVSPVSGETTSDVLLTLEPACFLSGRITDKEGRPVANANLSARGIGKSSLMESASTNAQGGYKFEKLPSGAVDLEIRNAGRSESTDFKNVPTCRHGADFEIAGVPRATFTGRVIDWKTGAAPAKWDVSTDSDVQIEKPTDQPGTFIVRDLTASVCYEFVITSVGYEPLRSGVMCMPRDGKSLEREFILGPGGTARGRIVHIIEERASPVPGITVTTAVPSEGEKHRSQVTDADGYFVFENLAAGKQREFGVFPKLPFLPKTVTADIAPGEETDLGDIAIRTGTTLKGKVVRMPGEAGVADVLLELGQNQGRQRVRSGTDGAFEFVGLAEGDIDLRMPELGTQASVKVTVTDVEVQEITVRLGSTIMRGRVTKGGVPHEAQVGVINVGSMTIIVISTGLDGTYELGNLLPGPQMAMVLSKDNQELRITTPVILPESGEFIKDFAFPGATITGLVEDQNGMPVEAAAVTAFVPNERGITDLTHNLSARSAADGTFTFNDVPPGLCTISAEKEGAGRGTATRVEVPEAGTVAVPPIRLQGAGGTLESLVYDLATGEPLQSAQCKITGSDGAVLGHSSPRDASGLLTVTDIPPGAYTVEIFASSYTSAVHQVEVKAGETTRLEDVLEKATEVMVTVMSKSGVAISDAECTLAPADANSIEHTRTGRTNQVGMWQVGRVTKGTYVLSAKAGTLKGSKTISIPKNGELQSVVVE